MDVIAAVCEIARRHRRRDGKSLWSLVRHSGIGERQDLLSAELILEHLRLHANLILDWFQYSEDKRTSHGWYIRQAGEHYVVGRLDGEELIFSDSCRACAEFVVREIAGVVARSTD